MKTFDHLYLENADAYTVCIPFQAFADVLIKVLVDLLAAILLSSVNLASATYTVVSLNFF